MRLEDSPLGGARFVITLPARALPDSLFDVAQHVESTHVDARRRSGTGTVVPLR